MATINFAAASISYQEAFPTIWNMQTAVFTSPTIYYAGSYDPNFNTDVTSTYSLNGGKQ